MMLTWKITSYMYWKPVAVFRGEQGRTQSWTLGAIWVLLLSFSCKKFLNTIVCYRNWLCFWRAIAQPAFLWIHPGGKGVKCPPKCHRVRKFSAKGVDQRLNTRLLKRKLFSCLSLTTYFIWKTHVLEKHLATPKMLHKIQHLCSLDFNWKTTTVDNQHKRLLVFLV